MNILENLLPPIVDNILGYDLLIIFVAVGSFIYFVFIKGYTNKVYRKIHKLSYAPDSINEDVRPSKKSVSDSVQEIKNKRSELRDMREITDRRYTMFVNLTSIFPLLGILGTVISLIPLVENMHEMEQNFFVALTSTLWGLVFSIIFKVLDSFLSPAIEKNDRGIEEYLEKLDKKSEEIEKTEVKAAPEPNDHEIKRPGMENGRLIHEAAATYEE